MSIYCRSDYDPEGLIMFRLIRLVSIKQIAVECYFRCIKHFILSGDFDLNLWLISCLLWAISHVTL